jgi:hypothetical protein
MASVPKGPARGVRWPLLLVIGLLLLGLSGCFSGLRGLSREGGVFGDREQPRGLFKLGRARVSPRVSQRTPPMYSSDPTGAIELEPTPEPPGEAWWLFLRGQW